MDAGLGYKRVSVKIMTYGATEMVTCNVLISLGKASNVCWQEVR